MELRGRVRASSRPRRSRSATRTCKVEKVTGWELGYKGSLSEKAYVTIDGYINQLKDFVTDLLPGVNQAQYPSYALDDEVNLPAELATLDGRLAGAGLPANHPLRAAIPQLLGGYAAVQAGTRIGGANALATLPSGSRAIVLSYTNAGKVTERGVEVGLGYQLTPEFRGDVTFTGFDFTVKSQAVGDQLVPNTPSKKGSVVAELCGAAGRSTPTSPSAWWTAISGRLACSWGTCRRTSS